MMEPGPPDQKRPRLTGSAVGSWPSSTETSRQLPPVPTATASYQHPPPFSRPPEPPHLLDRRTSVQAHIEHAQYDQEPRRPSSGPHVYHQSAASSSFGPREAMVKRDPSAEPIVPQYRPSSTGTPGDHNVIPPPPHHDPGRYHPPPFEPQVRPAYQTSFPPPQSPMSATDQYHPQFTGPARDTFPSVTYPATSQGGKPPRKAQRAAQACDNCRTLKAKCDEGRPQCSSCKEKSMECHYRDPPPKQQDKTSQDMLDGMSRIEEYVRGLGKDLGARIEKIERFIQAVPDPTEPVIKTQDGIEGQSPSQVLGHVPMDRSGRSQDQIPSVGEYALPQPQNHIPPLLQSTESPHASNSFRSPGTAGTLPYEDGVTAPQEEEEESEEGGDPGPPKPPSIPLNHTTGAARLLLAAPIAEMCKSVMQNQKIKNEKYPIVQEEKRGLLRLFGRGEGTDAPPGYDTDPLIDHDSTSGDGDSDAPSPAHNDPEWGQVGGMTPPGNYPPEFLRGALNSDGMPNLSPALVWSLVNSYKENINNMHPLLIPKRLDRLVKNFLDSIPDTSGKPKQVSTLVAGAHSSFSVTAGFVRNPESPGNKRKRSPIPDIPADTHRDVDVKSGHPWRTTSTCLVLLVLALGAISEYKAKIPDCVDMKDAQDAESMSSASPTIRNGHPVSPMHSSPPMSTPMGISSPQDTEKGQPRSRRTSVEGQYTAKGFTRAERNLDKIPGLAYFAMATDIIGNQLGGNNLQHVHCNVLAGLYHGQLGRVLESSAYISTACRSIQIILRPKLDRFKKLQAEGKLVPAKDNPLIIAFWTCLQLESDIVAELPVPHSGILTYEEDMPGPNLQLASTVDGIDPLVMESYSAQLYLRKHLNKLHNMFYRPKHDPESLSVFDNNSGHFPTIMACEQSLKQIKIFAPHMTWKEDDPLARTILDARLRAKYYGAKVITYRHFVLKVLEHNALKSSKAGQQISGEFKTGIEVPSIDRNAKTVDEIDSKVLEYAKNCIDALIKSTSAFHGMGDPGHVRPIVTNIWGTAHAQWGNILTLEAAYNDPMLHNFVEKGRLQELLQKTLAFLKLCATPSSALNTDYKILHHTGVYLGLIPADWQVPPPSSAASSFSSNLGDTPMDGH